MRISLPLHAVLWPAFSAAALWGASAANPWRAGPASIDPRAGSPSPLSVPAGGLAAGWTLEVLAELPGEISALAAAPSELPDKQGFIYAGTTPNAGVYRFHLAAPKSIGIVGEGLGDDPKFGTSNVNVLTFADVDRDGKPELLASTSQIYPRGRPRLYVWSLDGSSPLQSVTRPRIGSSWSHGFGLIERPAPGPPSLFITFCGNGEVVEYQMAKASGPTGFSQEAMQWKQVGQLPASGEWAESADVDNDGRAEVCLAAGFAPGQAAVLAFSSEAPGAELRLKHRLDEGGRFGNVRFRVGPLGGDGAQELIAWWCTGLGDGDCEIIRYRLGPEGVRRRTVLTQGDAKQLWPQDGQSALWDMDGDGRPEVWFATSAGSVWNFDPARETGLVRVLHLDGGIGPIAGVRDPMTNKPVLLLGRDRAVLRLEPSGPAPTGEKTITRATASGSGPASG